MFPAYLELGFDHILNVNAYDHILFLVALCAIYASTDWKRILILVTAFTIGHSITLALSSLDIISVEADLVELLIPITILLTALQNLFVKPMLRPATLILVLQLSIRPKQRWRPNYFLALFFGFIHGMGFSNYFKVLLGKEANIITPLFGFNLGVEIGQLCIVTGIMLLNYLVVSLGKVHQRRWNVVVSSIAIFLSVYMIFLKI